MLWLFRFKNLLTHGSHTPFRVEGSDFEASLWSGQMSLSFLDIQKATKDESRVETHVKWLLKAVWEEGTRIEKAKDVGQDKLEEEEPQAHHTSLVPDRNIPSDVNPDITAPKDVNSSCTCYFLPDSGGCFHVCLAMRFIVVSTWWHPVLPPLHPKGKKRKDRPTCGFLWRNRQPHIQLGASLRGTIARAFQTLKPKEMIAVIVITTVSAPPSSLRPPCACWGGGRGYSQAPPPRLTFSYLVLLSRALFLCPFISS